MNKKKQHINAILDRTSHKEDDSMPGNIQLHHTDTANEQKLSSVEDHCFLSFLI